MLTTPQVRIDEEDEVFDLASKDLFPRIRKIAAAHPGSMAAHIVAMSDLAFGDLDNVENPEEGFYRISNFGNLLEDYGFKINRYPETSAMAAQNKARMELWARWDEAKAKGEPPPPPPDKPLLDLEKYVNAYGVADNLEQVKTYLKEFIEDQDRHFVIGYGIIQRNVENKGKGGGWRWRKWGPYIGVREPTTEYLDDEPEIDQVYIFHIYEILEESVENEEVNKA